MKYVYKILTGNEHGGAANASELLIDGIFASKEASLNFHVIMLCKGDFALKMQSKHCSGVTVLPMLPPPVLSTSSFILKIIRSFSLLLWFIRAFIHLSISLRDKHVDLIHTTNNYALVVCSIYKLFNNVNVATHWRCIGDLRGCIYRWLVSHVDAIYCISNAVKDSLPSSWHSKCVIVYDGCDVGTLISEGKKRSGLLRDYLHLDSSSFMFGTIGTFSNIKCHELLIDCCHSIRKINSQLKFTCVLFGSCPNDLCKIHYNYLKKKVADCNLEDYVKFVFDDEIAKPSYLISDFDLFVGSTWLNGKGEGFGLVYVEALSQGIPVLAIGVGAAKELIVPSVGVLCSSNSVEEHVHELLSFSNVENRAKYEKSVIRKYAYKFDLKNNIDSILDLYSRC